MIFWDGSIQIKSANPKKKNGFRDTHEYAADLSIIVGG